MQKICMISPKPDRILVGFAVVQVFSGERSGTLSFAGRNARWMLIHPLSVIICHRQHSCRRTREYGIVYRSPPDPVVKKYIDLAVTVFAQKRHFSDPVTV